MFFSTLLDENSKQGSSDSGRFLTEPNENIWGLKCNFLIFISDGLEFFDNFSNLEIDFRVHMLLKFWRNVNWSLAPKTANFSQKENVIIT